MARIRNYCNVRIRIQQKMKEQINKKKLFIILVLWILACRTTVYVYCTHCTVVWNRKWQIRVVGRFFFLIGFKVFLKNDFQIRLNNMGLIRIRILKTSWIPNKTFWIPHTVFINPVFADFLHSYIAKSHIYSTVLCQYYGYLFFWNFPLQTLRVLHFLASFCR